MDLNGMSVNAEVFAGAGAEAGLSPSDELQWIPPNSNKPVSLAMLTLEVAANAGAVAPGFAQIDPEYLWMDREGARTLLAMEHGDQAGQTAETGLA